MIVNTTELKHYEFNERYFDILKGNDYAALKADIKKNGIKTELHILPDNTVICGNQRLRIAKELGLKHVPAKIVSLKDDEITEYSIKDNLLRRHLSPEQKAFLIYEIYKMRFKEQPKDSKGKFAPLSHYATTDVYADIGKEVGQNRATVARHVKYAKLCEAKPERMKEKITYVLRKAKQEKQILNIAELERPEGKFNVIVMDPPWASIGDYDPDGFRGAGDYPTMTIEEIKNIDVPAADDCMLWLWVIDLHLKDALNIIEGWGFDRKTTLVWVKDKFGLGHWLRHQHELCFFAVKGKPLFLGNSISSVITAPRTEHSKKPDAFYDMVDKATPKGYTKIDYFSRQQRKGWVSYGDEIDGTN